MTLVMCLIVCTDRHRWISSQTGLRFEFHQLLYTW